MLKGVYTYSHTIRKNSHIEAYHGIVKKFFKQVDYRTFLEIE
jgi:hypothetical protein